MKEFIDAEYIDPFEDFWNNVYEQKEQIENLSHDASHLFVSKTEQEWASEQLNKWISKWA